MTWILPKQLHTLASVRGTEALISDLTEQSQVCEQSLLVRSKPSPARTWLQKWKRDSWTALLSGRILKPSHTSSFTDEWISFLEATHANHSQRQGSEQDQTTQDTFGLSSQTEFDLCDPRCAFSRTSKDTSRWDSPASSATWKNWVTKCRGAYSLRVKSVHLTNGKESSSWPTANARDWKDGTAECNQRAIDAGHQISLARAATCWAIPDTTQRGHGPSQLNRNSPPLASQVMMRPTPCAMESEKAGLYNKGQMGQSLSAMANRGELGLPDPVNHSTNVSRQELWRTPSSSDREGGIMEMRPNCAGKYKLRDHVHANWATATVSTGANRQKDGSMIPKLDTQVQGKLNPRWVETLMGLPVGWTMPSCVYPVTIEPMNCDCLETESCQQQQSEHLELF